MISVTPEEHLTTEECHAQLAAHNVGRIAFDVDDYPAVLTVNYRFVEGPEPFVVIRTRPGNIIDRAPVRVAVQIDGIDTVHRTGWWVLARGRLQHLDKMAVETLGAALDPHPWLEDQRDSWLAVEPLTVSGRRLLAPEEDWAFHQRAYL